jgi:hypothetical protein
MSRTNLNARAETAPLLPEHADRDDLESVDGQEEYPAWQFWRRWTSSSSPSHFGRGKANSNVNRWILYTLLLIVGFVIGNLVSRIHWPQGAKGDDKDGHGRDKGPRVPPIYELPLVSGEASVHVSRPRSHSAVAQWSTAESVISVQRSIRRCSLRRDHLLSTRCFDTQGS